MTIRRHRPLSRRAVLPLIAAAALSPALIVRARAQDWQAYRREDLGFEVEMPGQPKLSEDKNEDGWTSVDAEVTVGAMLFAVSHQSYRKAMTIPEVTLAQRMAARHLGMSVVRERTFTINGFPALEFVMAGATFSQIIRIVSLGNSTVGLLVNGERAHEQPEARRFLDSLKLFRSAP